MIGYGFMGRTHAHAYHNAAQFFDLPLTPVLKAVCGRDGAKAKAFADNWGATIVETDWKKLIANKDIDAIDIVTPNDSHADIAIASAKAGKAGRFAPTGTTRRACSCWRRCSAPTR